jgi:hypothetical protein
MLPKVTDYWDEQVGAIDAAVSRLAQLDATERATALGEIVRAIQRHTSALDDKTLVQASIAVTDDLYKAASRIGYWDQDVQEYLAASAGSFASAVRNRGWLIQYLVDNSAPDMSRPLELFPEWFPAAGFVYVCAQAVVPRLVEADPDAAKLDPAEVVPMYIDEARYVAGEIVGRCHETRQHFVQLDTDAVESSFDKALEHRGPSVLTIVREQAPVPGSKVSVLFPEGFDATGLSPT